MNLALNVRPSNSDSTHQGIPSLMLMCGVPIKKSFLALLMWLLITSCPIPAPSAPYLVRDLSLPTIWKEESLTVVELVRCRCREVKFVLQYRHHFIIFLLTGIKLACMGSTTARHTCPHRHSSKGWGPWAPLAPRELWTTSAAWVTDVALVCCTLPLKRLKQPPLLPIPWPNPADTLQTQHLHGSFLRASSATNQTSVSNNKTSTWWIIIDCNGIIQLKMYTFY